MKRTFLIFCVIFLCVGCTSEDDIGVNIRIKNVSTQNFENVDVLSFSLESLNSGETSEFRQFEMAYEYATVFLEIGGESFGLAAVDFVGETPLSSGLYTYEIGLNETEEFLTLNFVEE